MSDEVTAPSPAPRDQEQLDSVAQFVRAAKSLFPIEKVKAEVRATPKGLFVHKDFMPTLVEGYQHWLQRLTGGEIDKSESKCLKRLFNTTTPPLYYLVEQKRALIGHLIETAIAQPQQTGLPFYLGTLEDGRKSLHARDPIFLMLPHVQVKQVPHGLEFEVEAGKNKLCFSSELVRDFSRAAHHLRSLAEELPGEEPALREVFPVLLRVLERAHWAPDAQRLLIPLATARDKQIRHLVGDSLNFLVRRDKIERVYARDGVGLLFFLQRECEFLQRGRRGVKVGTVALSNPKKRELGVSHIGTTKVTVSLHAFFEFVKAIQREAPHGAREWRRYSVQTCIEELSELLALAEQIEAHKITRHLPESRNPKARYYINQRWIFMAGKPGVITHTIDKFKL